MRAADDHNVTAQIADSPAGGALVCVGSVRRKRCTLALGELGSEAEFLNKGFFYPRKWLSHHPWRSLKDVWM